MRTGKMALVGWMALLSLSAGPLAADGVVLDWYSPVTAGRGGVNLAHADNGLILLENPANMMHLDTEGMVDLNLGLLFGDIEYSDPENSGVDGEYDLPLNPAVVPSAAYIRKRADWAWGIGIFTPAGFGTEYDLQTTFVGKQRYRTFGAVVKLLPSVAVRLTPRLALGLSVGLAYGQLEFEGPYFVQTGPLAGVPTLADFEGSATEITWNAGLAYKATESTLLGLSYVEQTDFSLEGDATVRIFGIAPVPIDSDFDLGGSLSAPRSLGIGLRHDRGPRDRISADIIWYDWSESFDGIGLRLSNPTNPALGGQTLEDTFPLGYEDSVSYKVGWERRRSSQTTLRFGYVYHSVASANATIQPLIPAVLEHSISAGFGQRRNGLSLNWAYAFTFGRTQRVGDSDIVGGDFSDSSLSVAYHAVFLGVTKHF